MISFVVREWRLLAVYIILSEDLFTKYEARVYDLIYKQGHGSLDAIYTELTVQCKSKGWEVSDLDFLLICGDVQAIRNELDMNCLSVPQRYRQLGDFHKYYSQHSQAPVLTIVIGGNHEASNYLFELYHGGWLAPNIYYLGASGIIRYGPWRIAGLSGIYDKKDFHKPHHERLPYDRSTINSVYHVRDIEVHKLLSTAGHVDLMLSHDWPAWIELFGDHKGLYNSKPHFLESAVNDGLGSKPATQLLDHLHPSYWFSGHMHVKFSANVLHTEAAIEDNIRSMPTSDDLKSTLPVFKGDYTLGYHLPKSAAQPQHSDSNADSTRFLALGKVGPDHSVYLELLELNLLARQTDEQHLGSRSERNYDLHYDEEWLAITRAYNEHIRLTDPNTLVVSRASERSGCVSAETIAQHRNWVQANVKSKGLLRIPRNFVAHAPVHSTSSNAERSRQQPPVYPNRQTADFAELLQMENKFTMPNGIETDDEFEDVSIEFGWG